MSTRKQGYLSEAVEKLGEVRDTKAAVLPGDREMLTQLTKLSADMLHGLCDAIDLMQGGE